MRRGRHLSSKRQDDVWNVDNHVLPSVHVKSSSSNQTLLVQCKNAGDDVVHPLRIEVARQHRRKSGRKILPL